MAHMEELATVRWPFPREKNTGLGWAQKRREEEKGPVGRPSRNQHKATKKGP